MIEWSKTDARDTSVPRQQPLLNVSTTSATSSISYTSSEAVKRMLIEWIAAHTDDLFGSKCVLLPLPFDIGARSVSSPFPFWYALVEQHSLGAQEKVTGL